MPEGGNLTFSTSNINLNTEYCESSTFNLNPGEYLLLEVADTGIGIAPENLNRIFEPFFTTKEQGKGTGLGLSAAFGTVVQHHGAINAYSEPGRGTIFRIYLPIINANASFKEENHEITPGTGTILLIDDEPAIRFANGLLLESAGYKVLVAEDGITGLEILKNNLAEIDLILLDMIMPKMNGSECFKKIVEIKPEVKVILCSGFPQDADLAEMKDQGLSSFICKPCRADELTRKVAEAMSSKTRTHDSQKP
jgi:CheY-like chemotaxis protein